MTKATIKQNGDIVRVSIEGHAGDERVCAACSVLGQTLQQCLRDTANGGALEVYHDEINDEDGNMYIKVKTKASNRQAVGMMLSVIATGFMLLQEQYPDNVKLAYKR